MFCLRALGFDDILSSFPFPKRRYFSIFLLFFRGETAQKGEMGTKKKARSEERKRVFFFVFWRERFVCCFAQKNTDMNHHVLCKGGGRGRSTRFRGFLLRPTTITSKLRVLLLLLLLKKSSRRRDVKTSIHQGNAPELFLTNPWRRPITSSTERLGANLWRSVAAASTPSSLPWRPGVTVPGSCS